MLLILFLQNNILSVFLFLWFHFMHLFIFGCAGSCCSMGFSLVVASRGCSSWPCEGFSLQWLLTLHSMALGLTSFSSCSSWALEYRLNSCGTQAELFWVMWNLPKPRIKPVSPALAGGFFTTEPPRKPSKLFSNRICWSGKTFQRNETFCSSSGSYCHWFLCLYIVPISRFLILILEHLFE